MNLSPDSRELRIRNYGRAQFETVERMCALSANIAANMPSSFDDNRRPIMSHKLLMELQFAWSSMPIALAQLNNPANWNIDNLLTEKRTWDGDIKVLRQPKIIIDVEVTKPGNLSVRWFRTDDDIRKDAFERRDFERPPNELLFVRGFRDAFYDARRDDDPWRNRFASAVLETVMGAVEDAIELARTNFKVEINWSVDLKHQDNLVTGYEETTSAQREQHRLEPILKEKKEFEETVGMTCEAFLGLAHAYGQLGCTNPRLAAILRDHYSLDVTSFANFSTARKKAERLLSEVNSKHDEIQLTAEQAALSPTKPVRENTGVALSLNARIAAATETRTPRTIPNYPNRTHPASEEDLIALGVSSVSELVQRMNDHLLTTNDFPISVGDYPSNKRLFDRLVTRYQRLGLGPSENETTCTSGLKA